MNRFQTATTMTQPNYHYFESLNSMTDIDRSIINDKYFSSSTTTTTNHQYGQTIHQQQQPMLMMRNVDLQHYHTNVPINNSQQQQQQTIMNNGQPQQQQQRNPFITRSLCVVCGDRARGCNFGAITCASCKEFFRRNAFKVNKLKCYFQLKCEINVHSRRFCASCRLTKCYSMGMKSEYIMSDAQKQERNLKISTRKLSNNRHMDHLHQQIDNHHYNQSHYQHYQSENKPIFLIDNNNNNNGIDSIDSNVQEIIDQYIDDVDHHHHIDNSITTTTTIVEQPNEINESKLTIDKEEIDRQNMADERLIKLKNKVKIIRESGYSVTKFHLLLRAATSNHPKNVLTEHGSCRLKYLTSIVQILSAETISDLPTDQKFIDLILIAEIVTFNFIKMCKKLYSFQELSQEDQVALVKGSVMDTLIIWSMMTINLEKECWEALDLERNFRFTLKMEMLKEANPKLYEKHRCYVMSFEPEWRYNDYLMSLLIAIALFNPERPNIYNVQKIRNERNVYCNLMKQYLDTLYEEPKQSQETYDRLMGQLKLTEKISEYHMKTYFDLSTNEATKNGYGGLMMEIDDLNNITGVKTKRCCS
uniref:Nuclear hormone receptor HR96-like n=1 Tax=Dermatophagoides pteronyssinus TaxID=6956 RepID=A0A6P6YIF4_DERPT|nr:nuclear hormone receptor HR96-like [Dermatophagoides pteronyssinus]